MNFPRSLPFNSGCPYSQNPSYFQSLLQAAREHCPAAAQISDPDMFITFHSPACSQEAQSPDLGGLSPRSEDSLERTIKKLKLNENHTEESPEYRTFQQETQSILSDFQPWSNFQFDVSQGASTLEGEAGNVGLGSSLSGNISQCPMFEKMREAAEKECDKKPVEEEEDDEIIFLDSKPGNGSQNNPHKAPENMPSKCMRHLVLGQGGAEKANVHKGAKAVHAANMLGEHEKMLWQSFVKVHNHIPDFPANDVEHLDYITMILRHKAKHLFNIGKQQVKELTRPAPELKRAESAQTNNPHSIASQSSGVNAKADNGTPEDPRMVFNNPYHKQLLEKCPVMHDYFQTENPHEASPAPTQTPVTHTPTPQTPTPQITTPHIVPGSGTNLPNPHMTHMRMPVFPSPQPLMPCNTVISDKNQAIQLLNSWFGMGYNHFVRAQNPNNPGMSGCPMKHLFGGAGMGTGNPQPQQSGRERRGAFKAALTKMKGGSNRK